MLELGRKHKRGTKTFVYLLISKSWYFFLIGISLLYLSWSIYFDGLQAPTAQFLASHPDWYVSTTMLSEWLLLLGLSFFLVGYLRASVLYRNYKFILDRHAVHLRRGLFYVRETTIPYHHITNVHIARPYHYRLLGLAKLDIVTAADRADRGDIFDTNNKIFLVPIIDLSVARALSEQLLATAGRIRNQNSPEPYIDDDDETDDDES